MIPFQELKWEDWPSAVNSRTLLPLVHAAYEAGRLLHTGFYSDYESSVKADQSEECPYDVQAEDRARKIITRYTDVRVYGEEDKRHFRPNELKKQVAVFWDGVDGTTNFTRRIPVCNTTGNLAWPAGPDGSLELEAGVVYDFLHGEMFYALRGCGAFLNGQRLLIPEREFSKSVITYAPLRDAGRKGKGENEGAKVQALRASEVEITDASRRFGREFQSGGLELAWVASGRLDGYASSWTNPWDLGAGALIVREAGGKATNILGQDWQPGYDGVVAGSKTVHAAMLSILRKNYENAL
jgi:myo-inositol-1(or 4)-monophosphatase